jgi:hypothetical protein
MHFHKYTFSLAFCILQSKIGLLSAPFSAFIVHSEPADVLDAQKISGFAEAKPLVADNS